MIVRVAAAAAAAAVTRPTAAVAACAVAAAGTSTSASAAAAALTTAAAAAASTPAPRQPTAGAAPTTAATAAAAIAASDGERAGGGGGGVLRSALRVALCGLKATCAVYCVYNFVGFVSYVDGPSMFPTFAGRSDWVFAEALPGVADRVRVGDVVIAARPIKVDERVIKRVTAAAGDTVSVYRPGQVAPTQVVVPPGHVWLQGDNLILSRDSREYGPVPLALVQGRVVAQLLPYPRLITRTVG